MSAKIILTILVSTDTEIWDILYASLGELAVYMYTLNQLLCNKFLVFYFLSR